MHACMRACVRACTVPASSGDPAVAAGTLYVIQTMPGQLPRVLPDLAAQNAVREDLADVHTRLLEKREEA